jgi:hypothetical protein
MLALMIPPLTRAGLLPPGIHWATWAEFSACFGGTPHREQLLMGLKAAMDNLAQAVCRVLYIDGSFVTAKHKPNDFDACWSLQGVDASLLDPVLKDFSNERARQKEKFGGELLIAEEAADWYGRRVLDYFQRDKRTKRPKGIIAIELTLATE